MPDNKAPLVGDLRKLIAALPDDAPVLSDWAAGFEPADHEPGVEVVGFAVSQPRAPEGAAGPYLSVLVRLVYLAAEDEDAGAAGTARNEPPGEVTTPSPEGDGFSGHACGNPLR